MNTVEYLEERLPKLTVEFPDQEDPCKIFLEVSSSTEYNGSFTLVNSGGGMMEGSIYSDINMIIDPENFKDNLVKVNFSLNLSRGENFYTEVVIASNGGEAVLEFNITILPPALMVEEREIKSLPDFYKLWQSHPTTAKKTFIKHDFLAWLYSQNYEYLDLYEQFRKDPNKERGINNFFVFNKLKNQVSLAIENDDVVHKINLHKGDAQQTGSILVKRQGQGFVDENLHTNVPWIKLQKENITTLDFKEGDLLRVPYTLDKSAVTKKINYGSVYLSSGEGRVNIKVIMINFLQVKLNDNFLTENDEHSLTIRNNTGKPLPIKIEADGFIKFEKDTYVIESLAIVPFAIRLAPLQAAQKSIRKRPVFEGNIKVSSFYKDETFFENLKVVVGDFN